jgi:hypothetical protein
MLQYPLNDSITTVKYSQHSDVFPEFASRRHNQYLFANRRACEVHGDKGSLTLSLSIKICIITLMARPVDEEDDDDDAAADDDDDTPQP